MSLLVVGTVAYDSVKTPAGSRSDAFGGSAAYFSIAASYFARVGIVAVVGDDFRESDRRLLRSRGVDTSGLEAAEGKTFRWSGVYGAEGVGSRETLDTQLNVFARFSPKLDAARNGGSPTCSWPTPTPAYRWTSWPRWRGGPGWWLSTA